MSRKKVFGVLLVVTIASLLVAKSGFSLTATAVHDYKPSEEPHKDYYETTINSYDPEPTWHLQKTGELANAPFISGSNAVLVDLDTGNTLYEKNPTERRKIASLVKIMTAVIVLEHVPLAKNVTISAQADEVGENSMEVSEGEVYTVEELLYGMILHSGNDAAYALAEATAGNVSNFVDWMNLKAKELGLLNTHFVDPDGLDDSAYSTVEDLVKLTHYALKNPEFREIVKTVDKELISETHKYMYLQNQTNLLTTYPGVAGVKTGYTEEAGLSLVTYAKNDGKEVVGVVLNSLDRKGDMVLMLDYGYAELGVNIEHSFF